MFANIARFEFRYQLRNPVLWATAVATFLLDLRRDFRRRLRARLRSERLLKNAPFATLQTYGVISIVFMFVTTAFVANVVVRDDETGFGPILRSTRISKFDYLFGRFLGAFGVAALCLLIVPLATWLGTLMPWIDPHVSGRTASATISSATSWWRCRTLSSPRRSSSRWPRSPAR